MYKNKYVMKKVFSLLIVLFTLLGCGTTNKIVIKEYPEQMGLLKTNFPEVYHLYENGEIILNKIYLYNDNDSIEKVHVSYRYRNNNLLHPLQGRFKYFNKSARYKKFE